MKFIDGVVLIERNIFSDNRGSFVELYKDEEAYFNFKIKQSNFSISHKNVIRGLHIQNNPNQAKLVSCTNGAILDVIVDARKGSKTFGEYMMIELSSQSKKAVIVPHGCLHGFLSLENDSQVIYFVDSLWNKNGEYSVNPFDEEIAIDWPIKKHEMIISEKDLNAMSFTEFNNIR